MHKLQFFSSFKYTLIKISKVKQKDMKHCFCKDEEQQIQHVILFTTASIISNIKDNIKFIKEQKRPFADVLQNTVS